MYDLHYVSKANFDSKRFLIFSVVTLSVTNYNPKIGIIFITRAIFVFFKNVIYNI